MLSRWQSTIVDEQGNVQPLANLTVRLESDQSLAKMWASPGTTQPLPDGMLQADGNGYAYFYAEGGLYRITSAALGIDWRHVPLGELAGMDVADLGLGTAATRDVGTDPDEVPTNDLLSGFILTPENLADVLNASGVWVTRAIGEEVWLDDSNPAVEIPPTDNSLFRYIKLTAGENGSGGYNEGVLINESVSGSAPLIEATAEVNLPDSPFHGQTVRLLNTERRFVRAGESGAAQDDAFQGHGHESRSASFVGGSGSRFVTGDSWTRQDVTFDEGRVDKGFGTPRIADENRPRNIGRTVYMRIL